MLNQCLDYSSLVYDFAAVKVQNKILSNKVLSNKKQKHYRTIVHRSGGKYLRYSLTLR